MSGHVLLRAWAVAVTFTGLAWPALAQSDDQDRSAAYNAIIDNIDLLVDNYAARLARKYDLTENQDAYTKSLLRERSHEFLDGHEDELRGLVSRLFEVRTGGEMTAEELIEWGQRAMPVYEKAKRLVIDGNNDWREILTPEQKKIHDEDLRLMYQSFETTEDQLGLIVSGEMTVEEFRSPQRVHRRPSRSRAKKTPPSRTEPPVVREAPPPPEQPRRLSPSARGGKVEPRPAEQPTGQRQTRVTRPEPSDKRSPARTAQPRAERFGPKSDAPKAKTPRRAAPRSAKAGGKAPEGAWKKYVREFIEKYKLNDEQTQKANTVLADCESQRDRYLHGRQAQIEKLDRQIEKLKKSKDKKKTGGLSALTEKRKKVLEPIDQIFDQQLKPRLERLPTRAQRRAAEAAAKKPVGKKSPKPAGKKGPSRGSGE